MMEYKQDSQLNDQPITDCRDEKSGHDPIDSDPNDRFQQTPFQTQSNFRVGYEDGHCGSETKLRDAPYFETNNANRNERVPIKDILQCALCKYSFARVIERGLT